MSAYRDHTHAVRPPDEAYAREVLRSALMAGEKIVWADRPKRGLIYEPLPNEFVNAIWTLFSLLWVCSGFITNVSWTMALLGVPFVLIGVNGLLGPYVIDAWRRGRIVYGITNRRLLVATPRQVIAAPWLGELRTHLVQRGGLGHIRVVSPRLELRALANAEDVHRILLEAQATAPESAPASSAIPASAAPESAQPESKHSASAR